jgi:hypothetical protein
MHYAVSSYELSPERPWKVTLIDERRNCVDTLPVAFRTRQEAQAYAEWLLHLITT